MRVVLYSGRKMVVVLVVVAVIAIYSSNSYKITFSYNSNFLVLY